MSFTNIINSFLNVRNKVKDMDGNWVDQTKPRETLKSSSAYNVAVGVETDYIIFEEWDKAIVLESVEIGTNTDSLFLKLYNEPGTSMYTNQLFHLVGAGSARSSAAPSNLRNELRGSSYLECTYYNESSGFARVELKRPIYLPNGCRLAIGALSTSTGGNATFKAEWREIER